MSFERDGAELFKCALSEEELVSLYELSHRHQPMGAGVRLTGDATLSKLLAPGSGMNKIASSYLGEAARPIRAILFDKRQGANWGLGWHQDRTIAVRFKRHVAGFAPWSKKAGIDHVEPPFEIIEKMVTLRAHLDDCCADNGPLLIVPGSHHVGRIPVSEVEGVVKNGAQYACIAEAGDVWAYASAILHASNAAAQPTHRRVLHVDFSACDLPGGLEWFGID